MRHRSISLSDVIAALRWFRCVFPANSIKFTAFGVDSVSQMERHSSLIAFIGSALSWRESNSWWHCVAGKEMYGRPKKKTKTRMAIAGDAGSSTRLSKQGGAAFDRPFGRCINHRCPLGRLPFTWMRQSITQQTGLEQLNYRSPFRREPSA